MNIVPTQRSNRW